jgi:hypothetical protein
MSELFFCLSHSLREELLLQEEVAGTFSPRGGSGGPETRQEDCIQYLTGEPEDRLLTTDQKGRHDIIKEEKVIKMTSDQKG